MHQHMTFSSPSKSGIASVACLLKVASTVSFKHYNNNNNNSLGLSARVRSSCTGPDSCWVHIPQVEYRSSGSLQHWESRVILVAQLLNRPELRLHQGDSHHSNQHAQPEWNGKPCQSLFPFRPGLHGVADSQEVVRDDRQQRIQQLRPRRGLEGQSAGESGDGEVRGKATRRGRRGGSEGKHS